MCYKDLYFFTVCLRFVCAWCTFVFWKSLAWSRTILLNFNGVIDLLRQTLFAATVQPHLAVC